MDGPGGLVFLLLGALMSLVESITPDLSASECLALGLNRDNLMCSSCDNLKEFNLEVLEPNCRHCCTVDDVNAVPSKYPRAQLEVCGYVRGADPIIKLMDEDGDVMETLAIDKWNTDSVEEFLNTYLLPPSDSIDQKLNEV
ncbi:selenoprotein [Portunus trituberculatus]|uniref:Selenoprotein F n=1 Tax=Portunus trituberculatus TaxID=210409 RepID=A0A5B7CMF7_PORTR|nr:selenoprotein [Portunus trituberculatus]